jgi:predicted oxidoreductase
MTTNLVDASPRRIAGIDLEVGPLAFGTWRYVAYQVDDPQGVLETALDNGLTLVDTADVYGLDWGGTHFGEVEELLGTTIAASPQLRDRMVLATKGGITPGVPYDSGPAHLGQAIDDSLRRLQVDTIDLYQIHRPDLYSHPAQVAEALSAARDAGKIRAVGVSNHTPTQYEALRAHMPFPLASTQPEFSALHLHPMFDGTFDLAARDGLLTMAWSPVAGGKLAFGVGGPLEAPTEELMAVIDRLAEREDVSRVAVALAFVLAHPSRPVAIIGSQTPERIASSTAALSVQLTRSDCYDIIEASMGEKLP